MCPLSKNSCAKAFGSWSSSKSLNARLRVNSGSSTARYNKTSGLMKESKNKLLVSYD